MADCIGYLFERADEAPEALYGSVDEASEAETPFGFAGKASVSEMETPSGSADRMSVTEMETPFGFAGKASVSEMETPSGFAGRASAPEMEPQRAVPWKDVSTVGEVIPPLGGEFEDVKLFDRSMSSPDIRVDCGSFCHTDGELQAVEMDLNLAPTKEFPYNWMHRAGNADSGPSPFRMDITCSALLLIYKDSGSMAVGKAEVWVDGEKVLTADPHLNGWTHCNPLICFRGGERKARRVEVRMAPGDEEKEFTILGFGYVA